MVELETVVRYLAVIFFSKYSSSTFSWDSHWGTKFTQIINNRNMLFQIQHTVGETAVIGSGVIVLTRWPPAALYSDIKLGQHRFR